MDRQWTDFTIVDGLLKHDFHSLIKLYLKEAHIDMETMIGFVQRHHKLQTLHLSCCDFFASRDRDQMLHTKYGLVDLQKTEEPLKAYMKDTTHLQDVMLRDCYLEGWAE